MNKKLVFFWIFYTATLTLLATRFYLTTIKQLGLVFALCGLLGLFMIIEIIRKHKDFKITDDTLIIKQILSRERRIKLDRIKGWREDSFHSRGQVKRTVILNTRDGEKIVISDKDDLTEYEKLFHHLRMNFPEAKETDTEE